MTETRECHGGPPAPDEENGYAFAVTPDWEKCGGHFMTQEATQEVAQAVEESLRSEVITQTKQIPPQNHSFIASLPDHIVAQRFQEEMKIMGIK